MSLRGIFGLAIGGALLAHGPIARAVPEASPSASLLHFTDDASASGAPLLPGFLDHSSWSGLGRGSDGRIYVAVSNHQQPGGDVGLYRYDPYADAMVTFGTIRSISTSVGNWMPDESQYKVHTFLMQHADGGIYFASDDHPPTPFLRGAHLYRIDPASGSVEDYSQTTPYLMTNMLETIPNPGLNQERSGILVETYGIKGIGLHPDAPDLVYVMTYPDGYLIQLRLSTGELKTVGQSLRVSYAFYVSALGDVYYTDVDATSQTLYKYDASADTTRVIATGLPGAPDGEVGAIAPQADGRFVYFLLARSKAIYRLDTQLDLFEYFASACGTNWWRLYNLYLSPDEQSLYFVSNNNASSSIRRIDVATRTCAEALDVDALLGTRNLCFGGTAVWDEEGRFYAPVWTFEADPPDVALLRADVEVPEPGSAAGLALGLLLLAGVARSHGSGMRTSRPT
jgi:hypothetical protein